jgi:hypothetical protein
MMVAFGSGRLSQPIDAIEKTFSLNFSNAPEGD